MLFLFRLEILFRDIIGISRKQRFLYKTKHNVLNLIQGFLLKLSFNSFNLMDATYSDVKSICVP